MNRFFRTSRIIGTGMTKVGRLNKPSSSLMESALEIALAEAGITLRDLDGLIAVPSLSHPRFMEAHYLATRIGLLPHPSLLLRTIDTGGSGPVTALIEASRMIKHEHCNVIAIVAGDAVLSMPSDKFLERADLGCQSPDNDLPSPIIPNGYDRYAQWQMKTYNVTREQLAMCSVLMSNQAVHHPNAMMYQSKPYTLEDVLSSKPIGKVTNLLECARRADGGAALVVASSTFLEQQRGSKKPRKQDVLILGGGEASGPLYPLKIIDEAAFSCEQATWTAYEEAQVTHEDINWFGLYDCFPVCLIRAIEATGIVKKGEGGKYIEYIYNEYKKTNSIDYKKFPINTHGGLLGFGAPWEVPAMYNIIEAVYQITNRADKRQIPNCKRALVYGNGGIFSNSSVAILSRPIDF